MRKAIFSRRVIDVTPGSQKLTRKEFMKSKRNMVLVMIASFAVMGVTLVPLAGWIVTFAAGIPFSALINWPVFLTMATAMTVMGALASIGILIDPIPFSEAEVEEQNRKIYNELKEYFNV